MARLFGLDVAVLSTAYGGRSQWIRGYPDQALEMVERSVALARERGRPFDVVTALSTGAGYARLLRGEVSETRQCAMEAIEISEANHYTYLQARDLIELGWCHMQKGDIFTIQHENQPVLITALEIEGEFATCDLNHPWAGQTLSCEIKLQKILPGGRSE